MKRRHREHLQSMNARRHLKVLVCLAVMAVVAGVIVIKKTTREPQYMGKSLTQWVDGLPPIWESQDTNAPEVLAIQAIGSRGLPHLYSMVRESAHDGILLRTITMVGRQLPGDRDLEPWRGEKAARAFHYLGEDAEAYVPQLRQLLYGEKKAPFAAYALAGIEPAGFSVVTNAFGHPSWKVRFFATGAFTFIEERDNAIISLLIQSSQDFDASVRSSAATALGRSHGWSEQALPPLINMLNDQSSSVRLSAVCAIIMHGDNAHSAVPALTDLVRREPDTDVRRAAKGALNGLARKDGFEEKAPIVGKTK